MPVMKSRSPKLPLRALLLVAAALASGSLSAAPIPKLYSTGVNDAGALLGPAERDPHYTLIVSADESFPGPDAFTLAPGFPVGPWIAEGPASRWIAPRPQQGIGNQEGDYIYRTTFDLTGFDPAKAVITGKWAVDNSGVDILINGVSLGIFNNTGFGGFADFTIDSGFVAGVNTLDFHMANAPSGVNPTGIRVELRGTVEVPDEAPSIIDAPTGQTVLIGDPISLSVTADGTPPLSYEWRRNNSPIEGASESVLNIEAATLLNDGSYTVVIRNAVGSITNSPVAVHVLNPIPGLFNTGVDESGFPLPDGSVDAHYVLSANPDSGSAEAIVHDTFIFPIVGGPWLLANETSAWIAPLFDTSAAAGGNYRYRIEVNLTGLDPTTAFVSGRWASDNDGDLFLNGVATGIRNTTGFGTWTPFMISAGFLSGTNIIEFQVNNASAGYTGLRVDSLRGGARPQTGSGDLPPRFVTQPVGGVRLVGETITLSVLADGTAPLSYRWSRNGQELEGRTQASLTFNPISAADAGTYVVNVRNNAGNTNSAPVVITVLDRVPGVFSTGVNASGAVLEDGLEDPHYQLTTNPNNPEVTVPVVHDSTIFPIVTGPWLANTALSKWISPEFNTVGSAGGDYVYRTSFDLTGFDPASAVILGGWATDNAGTGIRLNGQATGLENSAQFGVLTPFTVTTGFNPGINTLEFLVNNSALGYTALRVENLRVGANRASASPSLQISPAASGVRIAWPKSAAGFRLTGSGSLAGEYLDVNAPVVEDGESNTVTLEAAAAAQFYRLTR